MPPAVSSPIDRRRVVQVVAITVAVLLVAAALVTVAALRNGETSAVPTIDAAASSSVVNTVISVPQSALDAVGAGSALTPASIKDGKEITADGKPLVLYVGAEFCPYCAAERWAVTQSLSRFGTFTGVGTTTSAADDAYPSTATLTFHGAKFASDAVTFQAVETTTNQRNSNGSGYQALDTPTAEQQQLLSTYDAAPYVPVDSAGAIPFLLIGGKYLITGSSYDPGVLTGKTHQEIAASLSKPDSDIAKGVLGTANLITAAVCATTNNAPANVCTAPAVAAAAKTLDG